MRSIDERQIRDSFVNGSRGEVKRLRPPLHLDDLPWESMDFLGWVDPRAPLRSYLVVPMAGETLVGMQLRRNVGGSGARRARMCSLCLTTHPGTGVSLMVAPRAGRAGRVGNTVGIDICSELQCSRYARDLLPPPAPLTARETLTIEERVARLRRNLEAFVARVDPR